MRRIKKAFVASLIFLLLFCGYTVHADENDKTLSNSSQEEMSANSSANTKDTVEKGSTFLEWVVGGLSLIFGASVFGAVSSYLGIRKGIKEKNCDISSVEIELLQEKPEDIGKYAVFECKEILKDQDTFVEIGDESPYLYSITITAFCPSNVESIYNLAIREFDIEINGYKYLFKPINTDFWKYKFCNTDFGENKCCLLVILHRAKQNSIQKEVNEISIFYKPKRCIMHIVFAVNGVKRGLYSLWRPKVRTVWFTRCKDDPSRIVIIKQSIEKGRLNNGFGQVQK